MNHKVAQVDSIREPGEILLEIDGLIPSPEGKFYFVLKGIRPVDLDYTSFEAIAKTLTEQGVQRNLAGRLCEEAYSAVQTGLLADAIAQRTRRVG